MSSYPTSEQLFVSEQNTNIPTRYQQDGLIGFVTENKVEPKIFEKMKIFTSHGKYSREPSKCTSSKDNHKQGYSTCLGGTKSEIEMSFQWENDIIFLKYRTFWAQKPIGKNAT